MKKKSMTIEEYVDTRKKENKGQFSELIGVNGFRKDLTVESFNKLKSEAEQRFEGGYFKKPKKVS